MHNWFLSIYVLKFLAVKQSCKSDSIFPNSIYNQGTMYFIKWKKVPFIYNYCMYTMTVILTLWITQVYVKFTKTYHKNCLQSLKLSKPIYNYIYNKKHTS